MIKESRKIFYDKDLQIEIFKFEGFKQSFPNHFHDYYVIGFMEEGERLLTCRNKEYPISKGDILLLNPKDNHGCVHNSIEPLSYLGINIQAEVFKKICEEITGKNYLPYFHKNIVRSEQLETDLRNFYELISLPENQQEKLKKEELFLFLISNIIENYSMPFEMVIPECHKEVEKVCSFIDTHYGERLSLNQLCLYSGLSKSTLLRAFVKIKGITPYRYLAAARIEKAKKLLEQGISLSDTAFMTGFSDQSHFTNFFSLFTGITPAVYQNIFSENKK